VKTRDIIRESSGYSLEGSYTPDLIFSKLWITHELEKIIDQPIPVAYILGSWYSNLSTILRKKNIPVEKIIDVDKNRSWLRQGQKVQKAMGIDDVDYMSADANEIDYRQLQEPGLVINSSLNDIPDHGWFQHIPSGTLVVLQGRDNVAPGAEHTYNSPEDILEMYPLDKVLYQGQVTLDDPETEYQRSMVIGIKGDDVPLNELMFKGSLCTKDCSGHRAGYDWSMRKGGVDAASWSPSFNKGAALFKNGY
jgi:hypothetical protein